MERFEQFTKKEVVQEEGQQLDDKTRYMAVLAALIGCGVSIHSGDFAWRP